MNNRKIQDIFTFAIAFLTPWPFFIDLNTFSPVIINYDHFISYGGIEGDLMVPIGLFSSTIFLIFTGIKSRDLVNDAKIPLVLIVLFNIVYFRYGFVRILSILFPFISLLGVGIAIRKQKKLIEIYSRGFLVGLTLFLSLNLFSLFFYNGVDILSNNFTKESVINLVGGFDFNYARQIFGLEIYQYYISIASVISLFFGTTYLLIFIEKNNQKNKHRAMLFMLSSTFILSISTLRRANFVEFFAIFLISLIYIFIKRKVSVKQYVMTTLSLIILITSFSLISLARTMDYDLVFGARNYLKFISQMPTENFSEILFGYRSEFGGFSNLFLELFASSGIVGVAIYFVIFLIIFIKIYKLIYSQNKDIGILFIFISFNLFIGNFVNMNLTQPYYVCNFSSLLLVVASLKKSKI